MKVADVSANVDRAPPGNPEGYARLRQSGQAVLALATWAEGIAVRIAGVVRAVALLAVLVAVVCAWLIGSASEAHPAFRTLLLGLALVPAGVLLAFYRAVRRVIGMPRRMTEMLAGTAQTTLNAVGAAGQTLRKRRPTFRELLSGIAEARTLVDSGLSAAGLLTDARQMVLAFNPVSLLLVAGAVLAMLVQALVIAAMLVFPA